MLKKKNLLFSKVLRSLVAFFTSFSRNLLSGFTNWVSADVMKSLSVWPTFSSVVPTFTSMLPAPSQTIKAYLSAMIWVKIKPIHFHVPSAHHKTDSRCQSMQVLPKKKQTKDFSDVASQIKGNTLGSLTVGLTSPEFISSVNHSLTKQFYITWSNRSLFVNFFH